MGIVTARALNVGCGAKVMTREGDREWTNVDRRSLPGVDVLCDLRDGLPFGDDVFAHALADNVLEHLESDDAIHLLNEIGRVTAPGGTATIVVPHALSQGAYQDPTHLSFWVPRSALYWNQRTTPHGGAAVGISADFTTLSARVSGDMVTEAFVTFELRNDKVA